MKLLPYLPRLVVSHLRPHRARQPAIPRLREMEDRQSLLNVKISLSKATMVDMSRQG
jgi:hypothetical protein